MVVCFSGGLDSYIAWLYLGKPKAIYCNLKTKYSSKELLVVKELSKLLDMELIIDDSLNLGKYEHGINAYIPNRNLLIGAIASNYDNNICIAGVKGDAVEDKSEKSFGIMSDCLTKISKGLNIKLFSPFWSLSKEQIVSWYIQNNYPIELLNTATISCYSNEIGQCGQCPSCFRKAIALEYNDIEFESIRNMWEWKGIQEYISKMKQNLYDEDRTRVTFAVLRKKGFNI